MGELEKIEQLVKNASSPRQKAMAESLLKKYKDQQQTFKDQKSSEIEPPSTNPSDSHPQPEEADKKNDSIEEPQGEPLFKAVGIIQGEVNLAEDGNNTVTIKGKVYRLKYAYEKRRTFEALKLEIKKRGKLQRLVVYPRVIHFPSKDQPHMIYFELVGFQGASVQDKGIINELNDLEFKLSGLWQFIPVCRVPCVSIFRNFSESRKLFIKQAQPFVKVRFMKAAHLPLLWNNSPTRPFRFNPKLGKEENQGKPKFVQIKARFLSERDSFGFIEQLSEPLPDSPRFLKARKEDKLEARNNSSQSKSTPKTSKPSTKPLTKEIKPVSKPISKPIKKAAQSSEEPQPTTIS